MLKRRTLNLMKIFLTKVGLKPIIISFLHSSLWKKYLHPTIFFFLKLPLRLKYFRLIRINKLVPTNHLIVIDVIQKLTKIYEPNGIKFFLIGGLLLGGIRQESFAGDPGDIDIGLTDVHFDKFYKHIDLIKKNFDTLPIKPTVDKKNFKISDPDFSIIQKNVKKWTEEKTDTFYRFEKHYLQFVLEKQLVDIKFFSLKNINGRKFWVGGVSNLPDVRFDPNELLELDVIRLYGLKFYSPKNPEKYLDVFYGKNWKIPNKKQFFWKRKI